MSDIKKYKVTLNVLSGIHIGYGKEYLKFEYIKKDDEIIFIDEKKLFNKLCDYNLQEEYFDFIEKSSIPNKNSDSSLYEFLKNKSYRKYNLDELINEVKLYSVNCNNKNLANVNCFVKDKATNKCYIPGSTIKGMISTMLSYYLKQKDESSYLKNIMSAISVGDSSLISTDCLQISDVYYYNIKKGFNKTSKAKGSINQYYEFLKKGTTCTFYISIKNLIEVFDDKGQKTKPYTGEAIFNVIFKKINDYFNLYKKCYLQFFENGADGELEMVDPKPNTYTCFIGQKCGLPNKSIYYQTEKDAGRKILELLKNNFRRDKNIENNYYEKYKISPICLKIIKQGGRWYPCGAVSLTYEEGE